MPGLIDCHIHLLNMWTTTDEKTMAADIKHEIPKRLEDFLAAGVTSVKSVGDSEDAILRVRAMLESAEVRGLRLLTTGAAFAAPGSHPATTIYARNGWIRRLTHGRRWRAWPIRRWMRSRSFIRVGASTENHIFSGRKRWASTFRSTDSSVKFSMRS